MLKVFPTARRAQARSRRRHMTLVCVPAQLVSIVGQYQCCLLSCPRTKGDVFPAYTAEVPWGASLLAGKAEEVLEGHNPAQDRAFQAREHLPRQLESTSSSELPILSCLNANRCLPLNSGRNPLPATNLGHLRYNKGHEHLFAGLLCHRKNPYGGTKMMPVSTPPAFSLKKTH